MLDLDSDGWNTLSHAYGSAGDIPGILRRLPSTTRRNPKKNNPWEEAWSSLCHQFCVDTASYAAVPHLVQMAAEAKGEQRLEFLSLVGSIEAFRHSGGPEFPRGMKAPYMAAIKDARPLAIELLHEEWPKVTLRELLGIVAVLCGQPKLGAGIFLGEETYNCEECDHEGPLPGYAEFE